MVKEILLSQGTIAIVDDEDYERLSAYKWCYSSTIGYAVSREYVNGKKRALLMHRFILDAPSDKITDHINRDKLDNRKENLRLCSRAENNRNIGIRSHNKGIYKGVYWVPTRNKWQVTIRHNKKPMYLGSFENPHEAALMYNFWAKDLFGEFAVLNEIKGEIN
jgi:hypothetical protein